MRTLNPPYVNLYEGPGPTLGIVLKLIAANLKERLLKTIVFFVFCCAQRVKPNQPANQPLSNEY